MTISLTHGLRLVRFEDAVYGVYDANRYLGGVVRHVSAEGIKRFRAFGHDFNTLDRAVASYLAIPGVTPCEP